MKNGIFSRKIGMTQIYTKNGERVPVTVLKVGPCKIIGKRTVEKDGYSALRLGFEEGNAYRMNKPDLGQFKTGDLSPMKHIGEIRMLEKELDKFEIGADYPLDDFAEGDFIDVVGTSKGKGFQGVMRRHNFHGFHRTHGTHEVVRHAGSIGNCEWPGHVWKGKKMEGQMGNERVTVQNLSIARIDMEEGVFLIKGSVPGPKNGVLKLVKSHKKK